MAYHRSREMKVSVSTDTVTDTFCPGGEKVISWSLRQWKVGGDEDQLMNLMAIVITSNWQRELAESHGGK